jgi:subtilisin family serine protease
MQFLAALAMGFFITVSANAKPHDGYLVKFKKDVGSMGERILSGIGVKIEAKYPQIKLIKTKINPLKADLTIADRFLLTSMIEYVEPNFRVKAINSDQELGPLFNHKLINAPGAWEITKGSKSVIVAISDTGIWTHPDLKDNFWMNAGEIGLDAKGKDKAKNKIDDDGNGFVDDSLGWNFATNTKNPVDNHYHGTHVAGIVGAVGANEMGIEGVNWSVSLMSVKFLDMDGSGTTEGGIGTILYAADHGAKVVNCSWGGDGYTQSLVDAIDYAKSKGVLIVAAAGNDSADADKYPLYPAAYENENIISVASINDIKGTLSGFSNWGIKSVDIAAPGNSIYSTFNPTYSQLHRDFFQTLSGTSMAAPHVAGVIALMYSVNPDLKWNEVKDIIMSTGVKPAKLKGKILSESIVDAGAAVAKASSLRVD